MPSTRASRAPGAFRRFVLHPGRLVVLVAVLVAVATVVLEVRTSWLQSRVFVWVASNLGWSVERGADPDPVYPRAGPYDRRLGYHDLGRRLEALEPHYEIARQARMSPWQATLLRFGVNAIYREKGRAGLSILGRNDRPMYEARYPERTYDEFEAIPQVVLDTILYIENRELLREDAPTRNPAVEWDRLARAVIENAVSKLRPGQRNPGGSTLATQLEKLRHSPYGVTSSGGEKIRQIVSASLRAYQFGENTVEARRRIAQDYLNSLPLAATPGYGEVIGLGDGLWAWFGADFDDANRLLSSMTAGPGDPEDPARALALRRVVALCIAQRRPSMFLIRERAALESRTDSYLRLLALEGLIPGWLRDAALLPSLGFREDVEVAAERVDPQGQKASLSIRSRLAPELGIERLYDLDRLDLTVRSTLDVEAQREVGTTLADLGEPRGASEAGLLAPRLLAKGDPSKVVYSFTLYETAAGKNQLRVQVDTLGQPFNINESGKLELGSTAKLRVLVHYLELVAQLHREFSPKSVPELAAVDADPSDRLTRWAVEWLSSSPDRSLEAMLQAALERRYSASPAEPFFTGGGRHTFSNFDSKDDGRLPTVREAFHQSINLPFVRLMRDLVRYHQFRLPGGSAGILRDPGDPRRREYLERFVDREGSSFQRRFYREHHGRSASEISDALVAEVRPIPSRLAAVFRTVRPDAGPDELGEFLRRRVDASRVPDREIERLWRQFDPAVMNLADRGYVSGVHPLELWTASYLAARPDAKLDDVLRDGAAVRQEVYGWLFAPRARAAQDDRIRALLEVEAFLEIHRAWKAVGFPFDRLVPSLATALGSSGDRPAALAELVGILLNDGIRYPLARTLSLHFATDTPYQTDLERVADEPRRVLDAAVARAARDALQGVVTAGTARRARESFPLKGEGWLAVGGKTGTGDNRRESYGRGGRLIRSAAINRTATFVFFLGDRFFGCVTAYVPGEAADDYEFTSGLAVQVLRQLSPALAPLLGTADPTASDPRGQLGVAAGSDLPEGALQPLEPFIDLGAPDVEGGTEPDGDRPAGGDE